MNSHPSSTESVKSLRALWNEVEQFGYKIRSSGDDGLRQWQPFKNKYINQYVNRYTDGIPINKKLFELFGAHYKVDKSDPDHLNSVFKIGTEILCNNVETSHFFVQHARIPYLASGKLSVLKLLQIAYNAGQYRAVLVHNRESYPEAFVEFYSVNKLNIIETYIDSAICDMVPSY